MAAMGARRFPRWFMRHSPPLFGIAAAIALPSARRAVRSNLALIRGPAPFWRDTLETARTFATYASCLSETLARGSKNEAALDVAFVGGEHMHEAVEHGKGVLILTIHTAGWDVATPHFLGATSVEVMTVMEQERNTRAQAIQDEAHAPTTKFVRLDGDPLSALPIIRHLRNKGAVAMQIDRPPPNGRTLTVQLFGRPYAIPEGPFRLAQLSGAPLLPVFSARLGHGRYHVRTYPPIVLARRATPEELQSAAQRVADHMAEVLSRFPTQWLHFNTPM
jgi:KDO2-lipid IV(A) lauroyltransferase